MLQKYLTEKNIMITPTPLKHKILKYLSGNKIISSCKFYSLEEIKKAFFAFPSEKAVYEIMKEYHISSSLAFLYMEQIKYIEENDSTNEKIMFLMEIKQFLEKKKLLEQDILLKNSLVNQKIILYGYPYLTKIEKKILSYLQASNIVIEEKKVQNQINCSLAICTTVEEEVTFVAETILKELHFHKNMNQIKLFLPSRDYIPIIHRIFHLFHIPYHIKEKKSLISYDMTQYFLNLLKETEIEEAIDIIKETYDLTDPFLSKLYHKIIKHVNIFAHVSLKNIQFEILHTLFKRETIVKEDTGCITEITSLEEAEEDDIVFALGMHMNAFPVIYRDDDYLNDAEKEVLGLETSKEKNKIEMQKAVGAILQTHNIYISFASHSPFTEYARPSFLEILSKQVEIKDITPVYTYQSLGYNQFLLARLLDSFIKYNQKNEAISLLYPVTPISYKTYNHTYKPIQKEKLYIYIDYKMALSYSSIDIFYRCKFRFYLSHILKIKESKEESISKQVGNIVHQILFLILKENRQDYEYVIDEVMEHTFCDVDTAKTRFYKQKYKKEILRLIEIVCNQRSQTDFKEEALEGKYEVEIDGTLQITVKGFIDKVLTFKDQEHTYVIVVDYKTGVIDPNFNPTIYGMNMQLLIYHYLLSKQVPHYMYAGSYWQNIMKDVLPAEKNKTYESIVTDAYKWNGYTLKSPYIVNHIDHDLQNSFIKSMRFKADGDFYSYAKVLTEEEIQNLLKLTENHIVSAIDAIEKVDFMVNPKQIGSEKMSDITGCAFCPYRDICFKRPSDVVSLKEYKNLEFIKGDTNE